MWITLDDDTVHMGICASYAAGVVACDGSAQVVGASVERRLFTKAGPGPLNTRAGSYAPAAVADDNIETLTNALQRHMGDLEIRVAEELGSGDDSLIILDGPLTHRQHVPGAIGYVKSHQAAYLPSDLAQVVGRLAPGQRTPVFVTETIWSRYSWYLRLPGPGQHPWAGIVRCEASSDTPMERVRQRADHTALLLPGFSSQAHKDPRAPQNLLPISALERELRRRLGDRRFVERALRAAAGAV